MSQGDDYTANMQTSIALEKSAQGAEPAMLPLVPERRSRAGGNRQSNFPNLFMPNLLVSKMQNQFARKARKLKGATVLNP